MNRLSPKYLSKNQGTYRLVCSLDQEVAEFEKQKTICQEKRNSVGDALSEYLNQHESNLTTDYTSTTALSALISFFANRGLIVAQSPEQLALIRKNAVEKREYCIARFILEVKEKDSPLFSYILEMVKGFFVSMAIAFRPENSSLPEAKFKGLQCFLDTRIIIDALGLRLQSGKKAAIELLDMLKTEQATLCCFSHTVDEIRDIIKAYRKSLSSSGTRDSGNTLESWDEQHYSAEQVTRYLHTLTNKIEALGITIVSWDKKPQLKATGIYVKKFKIELGRRVSYRSKSAYDNDLSSVLNVMRLRNGEKSVELEKCKYIFITTNIPLIGVVDSCLYNPGDTIPPTISDMTMSSIVWLKTGKTHKDYPKYKLIEQAMLAIEPTSTFLSAFYKEIAILQSEGNLTEEEATIISTDIQLRRELVVVTNGDASNINSDVVLEMRDRLKIRYAGESRKDAEAKYQQYLAQKKVNNEAITQIIKTIGDSGIAAKDKAVHRLTIVYKLLWAVLVLAFIASLFVGFFANKVFSVWSIILLVLNILTVIDFLVSKLRLIKRLITKAGDYYAERARIKKQEELQPIIDKLMETTT